MKRAALVLLPAAAAIVGAQMATQRSADGNVSLRFRSFRIDQIDQARRKFTLVGGVDAASTSQGLRMVAQRAVVLLATKGKQSVVETMTGTGSVKLTKTAQAGRVTTIAGSRIDYQGGTTEATAKMAGPVTITDNSPSRARTFSATGASGVATLTPNKKDGDGPLRTATLRGGVRIEIQQAGKSAGTIVATGNQLVINNVVKPATITLTGNVDASGKGESQLGTLNGLGSLILKLDSRGEVTGVQGQ